MPFCLSFCGLFSSTGLCLFWTAFSCLLPPAFCRSSYSLFTPPSLGGHLPRMAPEPACPALSPSHLLAD